MNDLALFIIGVAVFTVTVMAVLWTGYLTFAKAADADQPGTMPKFTDGVSSAPDPSVADLTGSASGLPEGMTQP